MTIVYTAILGTCDTLKLAPVGAADRCVCFTDDHAHAGEAKGWEIYLWSSDGWGERDQRREAWRLRCIADDLFPEADVTVWVDASFTLTNLPKLLADAKDHDLSGLKHHARTSCYEEAAEIARIGQADRGDLGVQMTNYSRVGFTPLSLTISCILVRERGLKTHNFNVRWDREISQNPGDNTQLSLDYCAWMSGLTVHHLEGVRKDNPYAVHDHADHKRRRKPYVSAVAVR